MNVKRNLQIEFARQKTFNQLIAFLDDNFVKLSFENESWSAALNAIGRNEKIEIAFMEFLNCDTIHTLLENNFDKTKQSEETIPSIIGNNLQRSDSTHISPLEFLHIIDNLFL